MSLIPEEDNFRRQRTINSAKSPKVPRSSSYDDKWKLTINYQRKRFSFYRSRDRDRDLFI